MVFLLSWVGVWITLKKKEMVKKERDFNDIIKNSPFIKNKAFVIYIRKKESVSPNFGLAISKKVGNAVCRNKLKRRVRAMIDLTKESFPNNRDYIIMIKRSCVELSFAEMKDKLIELIKEIK